MLEDSETGSRKNTWQSHSFGSIKVNWDASLNISDGCIGLRFIAWDCMGAFLEAINVNLKMMVERKFVGTINTFPPT
jgi:hypothetical protein